MISIRSMFEKILKNKYTYISILVFALTIFSYYQNQVLAQIYSDNPGDELGVHGLLQDPADELVDINGTTIVDNGESNFAISPYADAANSTTGIRVGGTDYAGQFDGNVNIDGEISVGGIVVGSQTSYFTGLDDTPSEYYNVEVASPVGGWLRSARITIDSSKVAGTSNHSNYPFLFTGTYWFLRDWAHGGHVRSSNGYDIKFSLQESGNSPLDYELEYYDPTTGTIVAWIRIPSLNPKTDTAVYILYDNASIISSQENVEDTWVSTYGLVNHMNSSGADSSSVADPNNATFLGSLPDERDGKIHKAQHFDGTGDYMRINDDADLRGMNNSFLLDGAANVLSAWIKVDSWSNDTNDYQYIAGKGNWNSQREYRLIHRGNGNIYFETSEDGSSWTSVSVADTAVSEGQWHHLSAVYEDSYWLLFWYEDGELIIYVDGQEVANLDTDSGLYEIYNNSARFGIGSSGDNGASSGYNDDWEGYIDEVWFEGFSSWGGKGRQQVWLETIYNNQNSPDTFYSVEVSDVGKVLRVKDSEDGLEFHSIIEDSSGSVYSLWEESGSDIYYNTDNVGINTTSPSNLFSIKSNNGTDAEIVLRSGSDDPWAIYNKESSNELHFWNPNNPETWGALVLSDFGYMAMATSSVTPSTKFLLHGDAYMTQSLASSTLNAYNYSGSGTAIYAKGMYGVQGLSTEATGKGITGEADSPATKAISGLGTRGVYGNSIFLNGAGVRGRGGKYGGYFSSTNAGTSALYGTSDDTYAGIWGNNDWTGGGAGVRGDGLYGVYGTSTVSSGAGIRGTSSGLANTNAGYFEGDIVMGRYNASTPVYVDLYDDISAPDVSDCDVSYTPEQDIKVQRGIADIGSNGGYQLAPTDFTAFDSMTNAFVLNKGNRYMSSGRTTLGAVTREVDDLSGAIALTGSSRIDFYRDSGSEKADYRFHWEAWEYIGDPGGANEFIVRGRYQISVSSGKRTGTDTVASCSDRDRCIPFVTGIINGSGSNNADDATALAWMSADNTVTVERGGDDDTTTVYGVVVEFTGSNWSVAHGRTGDTNTDTGTIDLFEESVGTSGTTYNVSDWSNAAIFHQFKADDTADNEAIADTSVVYFPGTNSDEVDWNFHGNHDGVDNQHMVHVLENSDMTVTRYTDTGSAQGDNNIDISSAGLTDLSNAAVIGSARSSGTGTAYGRGWKGVYLTSLTNVNAWAHRSGNDMRVEVQVIDMPKSTAGSSSHFGRMMVETTNNLLYVCTDSGWQTKELQYCGNGIQEGDEVCDYGPYGTDDCSTVAGTWEGKVDKKTGITSYCKSTCDDFMASCLGF